MKSASEAKIVELDVEQLEAKLDQIERALGEETARPFRILLGWYLSLLRLIEQKNTSIRRLRRLLFGPRTERTDEVLPPQGGTRCPGTDQDDGSLPGAGSAESPLDERRPPTLDDG